VRPAVHKLQDPRAGSYQFVSESTFDMGFRESTVSSSACGERPVSNRTLEDPLEVLGLYSSPLGCHSDIAVEQQRQDSCATVECMLS
jgi:hypothetical protein